MPTEGYAPIGTICLIIIAVCNIILVLHFTQ